MLVLPQTRFSVCVHLHLGARKMLNNCTAESNGSKYLQYKSGSRKNQEEEANWEIDKIKRIMKELPLAA